MKKLLLAMVLILVASCGGSDSIEDATERYAKVMCDKIFTCEETATYEVFYGGSESNCVKLMTTDSEDDGEYEGEEGEEDDDCEVNFDKVDECISCYEKLSCEDFAASFSGETEVCPVCDETCE